MQDSPQRACQAEAHLHQHTGDARVECPSPRLSHLPLVPSVPTCQPQIHSEPLYWSWTISVSASNQHISFLWSMASAGATTLLCVTAEQLELGKISGFSALLRLKDFKSMLLIRETLWHTGHPQLPPLTLQIVITGDMGRGRACGSSFCHPKTRAVHMDESPVSCSLLTGLYLLLLNQFCVKYNSRYKIRVTLTVSQISKKSEAGDWNQSPLSLMGFTLNRVRFPLGDFALELGHF